MHYEKNKEKIDKIIDNYKDMFLKPGHWGLIEYLELKDYISLQDLRLIHETLSKNNLDKLTPKEFKLLVEVDCINKNDYTCDNTSYNINH